MPSLAALTLRASFKYMAAAGIMNISHVGSAPILRMIQTASPTPAIFVTKSNAPAKNGARLFFRLRKIAKGAATRKKGMHAAAKQMNAMHMLPVLTSSACPLAAGRSNELLINCLQAVIKFFPVATLLKEFVSDRELRILACPR
jgi:hypothetical protein